MWNSARARSGLSKRAGWIYFFFFAVFFAAFFFFFFLAMDDFTSLRASLEAYQRSTVELTSN